MGIRVVRGELCANRRKPATRSGHVLFMHRYPLAPLLPIVCSDCIVHVVMLLYRPLRRVIVPMARKQCARFVRTGQCRPAGARIALLIPSGFPEPITRAPRRVGTADTRAFGRPRPTTLAVTRPGVWGVGGIQISSADRCPPRKPRHSARRPFDAYNISA